MDGQQRCAIVEDTHQAKARVQSNVRAPGRLTHHHPLSSPDGPPELSADDNFYEYPGSR